MPESLEDLRARCAAAEDAASAAVAPDSPAHAELQQMRRNYQQMLDAMSLEVLLLKRELRARVRVALSRQPENRQDAEIAFDEIDAMLATTPLDN
jgi:hypothetical protein